MDHSDADQHIYDDAALHLLRLVGLDSNIEPSEYDSVNVVFRSKNGGDILVGNERFAK